MTIKIFFFIMVSIPLWANQCIQVLTLDRFEPNRIPYKIASILQTFDDARVERRGSYLVLRVGDYATTSQALTQIDAVRAFYHDAYIRRCDIEPSKIIYPKSQDTSFREPMIPVTQAKAIQQNDTPSKIIPIEKIVPQSTVHPQQNSLNTLWQDCQKCFAPIYLEEEEEPQIRKKSIQEKAQPAPIQPQQKSDNTFWIEAVDKTIDDKKNSRNLDYYDPTIYPKIKQDMIP
ncbi:MAG: hypothetical protein U9N52_01150 [Campylobacterota bacterium]|nr:hypothetical protein [Campylobacterota bacterium]